VGQRNVNHRLVKTRRTYTTEETARLFGIHRNTVRAWLTSGLPTIDKARPLLIAGGDLLDFLVKRRQRNKRPCAPGELYCLRCRVPRHPAGNEAHYHPITATTGNLEGVCPECSLRMFRRVNRTRLDAARGKLAIRMPEAPEHISKSPHRSVNCALTEEANT
jgi:hypothetical protein